MLRISDKKHLRHNLHFYIIVEIVLADTKKERDEVIIYRILSKGLRQQRYLFSFRISVSKFDRTVIILSQLLKMRFRNFVRMSRLFLKHIADLIRDNPVFQQKSCE